MTTPARPAHARRLPPLQSAAGGSPRLANETGTTLNLNTQHQVQMTRAAKTGSTTQQDGRSVENTTESSMVVTGRLSRRDLTL